MTWHAPPDVLTTFASRPEVLDDPTASSVEQHLLACADCRAAVAAAAPPFVGSAAWDAVADRIDRPRPTLLEGLLARLGVADDSARLVGATPGLQLSWLAAVVMLAVVAVVVSAVNDSDAFFLVVAPLFPLAATGLAFLPTSDPSGETGIATALHGLGVAVRRMLATVVPTVAVLAACTPFLPDGWETGAAWFLPSVALAAVSLLLATRMRVTTALAVGAVGWPLLLAVLRMAGDGRREVHDAAAFAPIGQVVAVVIAAVAVAGLAARRDRFATMEVEW